jgi:lambda family phage portal protein
MARRSRKQRKAAPSPVAKIAALSHLRRAMALSGGYTGGQHADRFAYWTPSGGNADYHIARDLASLRDRSHDLVRNSPIAAGAIETQVVHVVGTGLSLQSRIDAALLGLDDDEAAEWQVATEREFALWAESKFADATEDQNFYELQDLVFRTRVEAGDVFVMLPEVEQPGWPYRLRVQVIEAGRVDTPNGMPKDGKVTQGIERDAGGRPIAAHIADRHQVSYDTGTINWARVPFRGASGRLNLLHLKRKLRPGQTRGVPELAPIMAQLKQLDRFSTAEVDAAVNSAAMALFITMNPDAFESLFEDSDRSTYMESATGWDGGLQSGKAVNLLPGESVEAPTPGRPNPQFEPFFQAVMKQIGIGLNIPHEVLSKAFQSSYSAARAALLDAWRTFRIRREWLASNFCQPIYEEWLAEAVLAGRVRAPGFFRDPLVRRAWCGSTWSGDGPGAIDPLKEIQAAKERMDAGVSTLAEEVVAWDGGDWHQKHRQRTREVAERVEGGLQPPVSAPGAMPPARGRVAQPLIDDEDTDSEDAADAAA